MDIVYKNNTLYVYFDDHFKSDDFLNVQNKIDNIMGIYNICSLVINSNNNDILKDFETEYNLRHNNPVIINNLYLESCN